MSKMRKARKKYYLSPLVIIIDGNHLSFINVAI